MPIRYRVTIVITVGLLIGAILVFTREYSSSNILRAAFDAEFLSRPDGYQGLCKHYGLKFTREPMQMDPGLMYRALSDGAVDFINGFATDGRIPAYNLFILKDDKSYFPPYYAAPLIREQTLKKYPEIEDILNRLDGRISDKNMQKLNYQVDEKGRKAYEVAREFLFTQGLIKKDAKPKDGSFGQVVMGGKQFTEQEILGEMLAIVIECNSNLKVVRKLNLGGTMICFNALKSGDVDLYAEYTGTGLMNILKEEVICDPEKAYQTVKQLFKQRYSLIWLKPLGFNNTYTLTMRKDHARKLAIKNISDLVQYINGQSKE